MATPLSVSERAKLNGLPSVQLPKAPAIGEEWPVASAPALEILTPVQGFVGSLIVARTISVSGAPGKGARLLKTYVNASAPASLAQTLLRTNPTNELSFVP